MAFHSLRWAINTTLNKDHFQVTVTDTFRHVATHTINRLAFTVVQVAKLRGKIGNTPIANDNLPRAYQLKAQRPRVRNRLGIRYWP